MRFGRGHTIRESNHFEGCSNRVVSRHNPQVCPARRGERATPYKYKANRPGHDESESQTHAVLRPRTCPSSTTDDVGCRATPANPRGPAREVPSIGHCLHQAQDSTFLCSVGQFATPLAPLVPCTDAQQWLSERGDVNLYAESRSVRATDRPLTIA